MKNIRFELLYRINKIISTLDSFKSEDIKTQKLLFSDCFKNQSVFKDYKNRINNIMVEYDHGTVQDDAIENILDNLCVGFLYDEINIKYVPIFIGDKIHVFIDDDEKETHEAEIIKHHQTRFNNQIIVKIADRDRNFYFGISELSLYKKVVLKFDHSQLVIYDYEGLEGVDISNYYNTLFIGNKFYRFKTKEDCEHVLNKLNEIFDKE